MTTLGIVSVLLFHSVPAHPAIQVAHAWPYPYAYGWRPAPTYVAVCEGYECSRRDDDGELPWRLVSLSLSAGFAYAAGADVPMGGSGGAFGLRLGAGLVDRLSLTVALEGTRSRRGDQDESETAALVGLQWYPLSFLYFRGAAGAGVVSYPGPGGDPDYAGGGVHPALSAALGLELGDPAGFAVGLEGVSTWMHVPGENWSSVQISMVVSFF
jgi:hypothetical protein